MLSKEKLELVDEFLNKMENENEYETCPFDNRIVKQIIINLFDEHTPGEIERDESGQVIFYTGIQRGEQS